MMLLQNLSLVRFMYLILDTFTVNGEKLESYMADVDTDADYEGDHEAII